MIHAFCSSSGDTFHCCPTIADGRDAECSRTKGQCDYRDGGSGDSAGFSFFSIMYYLIPGESDPREASIPT